MWRETLALVASAVLASSTSHAQTARRNREAPVLLSLTGVPDWLKSYDFKVDKFTFVRVIYHSETHRRMRSSGWATDYPDADLNLCRHVDALTRLRVEPTALGLTDGAMPARPFLYLCEPGHLQFTDDEVAALRKHLEGGGFLMVDDFWGREDYDHFCQQLLRVFPNRKPEELSIDHEIFHCVFDLKKKPQVPSISVAIEGRKEGITWEGGADAKEVHYRAITDDAGRIMVLLCHNTDLSDGWERCGEDKWYAEEISAKRAFPMGINVVFYALTHR